MEVIGVLKGGHARHCAFTRLGFVLFSPKCRARCLLQNIKLNQSAAVKFDDSDSGTSGRIPFGHRLLALCAAPLAAKIAPLISYQKISRNRPLMIDFPLNYSIVKCLYY